MMIERQNILDLIGRYKNRYSSCIVTCFSFDFTFFEEKVMTVLRNANVKNINVFLDGRRLEHLMESPITHEFRRHKTYSLAPIYVTGSFHPKIMLLTGPKHGLLIIGSGNLTSSGMSINDEVWGAFHFNSLESQNASFFAETWIYLQKYFPQLKGFNKQKISWISQYSPWLRDLEKFTQCSFYKISKNEEVGFIANMINNSCYKQLKQLLPKKRINQLTIISPYFDENGVILEQFLKDFTITELVCVTDSSNGLLPIKLSDSLRQKINFYDWNDCIKKTNNAYNRLHAKMIHFEYDDGWEYLLMGSANATNRGLGTDKADGANAEAGLLLRRKSEKTYLDNLGIIIKLTKSIDLSKIVKSGSNLSDGSELTLLKLRIIQAEVNGDKLTVYFEKETVAGCELILLDTRKEKLQSIPLPAGLVESKLEIDSAAALFRIYIEKVGERVSNYSPIHNIVYLAKTNPDQTQGELQDVLDNLLSDPENQSYRDLLLYADFSWADDLAEQKLQNSGSGRFEKTQLVKKEKVYVPITEGELNKLASVQSSEHELLCNASTQIADVLNAISNGLVIEKKIEDSEEQALFLQDTENQSGQGNDVDQKITIRIKGEEELASMIWHLEKNKEYFQVKTAGFQREKKLVAAPKANISLKELSNISSAIALLKIFYGRKYSFDKIEFAINYDRENFIDHDLKDIMRKVENKFNLNRLTKTNRNFKRYTYYEVAPSSFRKMKAELAQVDLLLIVDQKEYLTNTYSKDYFEEGRYDMEHSEGIKYYLIEMLGGFLMCCNKSAGYKHYEYESVNDKMLNLRNDLFINAIFMSLTVHWNEREIKLRNILLLDLLNTVCTKKIAPALIPFLEKELKLKINSSGKQSPSFEENFQVFIGNILPRFIKWEGQYSQSKENLIRTLEDIEPGDIVYQRNLGFGCLKEKGANYLKIEKPGILWNEEECGNVLKLNSTLTKFIVFN